MPESLPESIDGLPNLCGSERLIASAIAREPDSRDPFANGAIGHGSQASWLNSGIDFGRIKSAFAIALHMHQPLIPAGGEDLRTAKIISNLRHMTEHPEEKDAHNAPVFRSCYKRMGEFIPQLVAEGKRPRVMLDYSGCLLHGLIEMGAGDVIEGLRPLVADPAYRDCVEWLGTAWGHAVAPSTPAQDFRLHVRAWQHHFTAVYGLEALARVRGFSPPEMALPNHPDVAYEFVRTLVECGYRWVLVQEHTVERFETGGPVGRPHVPHRLVARNSHGQRVSIVAIVKTQGSDNKLVAQMQPYYEAKGLERTELGGKRVPPLVTQIGDGENGGVMMNEFPPMFLRCMGEATDSETPAMNVSEYLEHLAAAGVREEDFPAVQPIQQKKIWDRFDGGGPEKLEAALAALRREDGKFNVEGGSWTDEISWVRGYENVLGPMQSASAMFAEKVLRGGVASSESRYREALFHLLMTQTSCYRYWGQGRWTDYGRELCRRTVEILSRRF